MRRPLASLALVVATAAVVWLRRPPPAAEMPGGIRPRASETPATVGEPAAAPARGTAPAHPASAPGVRRTAASRRLPRSLRGTSPDGELAVDDAGHLAVSRDTRRFFDYYLAATGEEPADALRARLRAAIAARLSPQAAAEALGLLDRYLAYRDRAAALPAGDDIEAHARTLHALRREMLGSVAADAFFGDDEALEAAALARRRISADESLLPEERARQLAAVEDGLPLAVRAARAQAVAPLRLMQQEQELRDGGASPAEIRALRERTFGAEAADRLDALDRDRAAWQARLDAYRGARDAVLADPSLSPSARAQAIEALRVERFTPTERLRVAVLDGDRTP